MMTTDRDETTVLAQLDQSYTDVKSILALIEQDYAKGCAGNASAIMRLRKSLKIIERNAKSMRKDLMDLRKKRDAHKQSVRKTLAGT